MSEETAVYQVVKKSSMNHKARARNYYAAAVLLFQDTSEDDSEIVIELLEKALNLYPDLDVCVFIEDVWHYLLKSLDRNNDSKAYKKAYKKYTDSPAWKRKRDKIRKRDEGTCVWCGDEGRVVHHKSYDNIGKEPLSDLILLCNKCHDNAHPDKERKHRHLTLPEQVRKEFIAYIDRESKILKLVTSGHQDYVNYESGYTTQGKKTEIHLSAWLPLGRNDVAAVMSIRSYSKYFESHYKKFEEHKSRIEDRFSFEEVKFRSSKGWYHLRVVKKGVDLMQTADRDAAFYWLRENLEKLYGVLRVHDTSGWDAAASTENP